MEQNKLFISIFLEIFWWLFTFAVTWLIMDPIVSKTPDFPFIIPNALFIILFITLTRYIFLLKTTWLYHTRWVQVVLILASIFIISYLIRQLNEFTAFIEEIGLMQIMAYLPFEEQKQLSSYIQTEYLLTGVGSIIAAILFPLRMIVAIWRSINRKK